MLLSQHLYLRQRSDQKIGIRLLDAAASDVLLLIAASAFYGLWATWDFYFDYDNNTLDMIGSNAIKCLVTSKIYCFCIQNIV